MNVLAGLNERDLCKQFCARVRIHQRESGGLMLETPFAYPDGDHYPLYLSEVEAGGIRISDGGHTLMHLSYENDIDKFFEGTRQVLLDEIVCEQDVQYSPSTGEFHTEADINNLPLAVFRLGQAMTRVYDLTFLNRARVTSTFYEDLEERIKNMIAEDKIIKNYEVPDLPNSENYPVDFYIACNSDSPLFLFGIPNRDKARLTTIFLQYYNQRDIFFDSMLVFLDQKEIPRNDLARLSNAGGEMIASLNADDDFNRKLQKKVA